MIFEPENEVIRAGYSAAVKLKVFSGFVGSIGRYLSRIDEGFPDRILARFVSGRIRRLDVLIHCTQERAPPELLDIGQHGQRPSARQRVRRQQVTHAVGPAVRVVAVGQRRSERRTGNHGRRAAHHREPGHDER